MPTLFRAIYLLRRQLREEFEDPHTEPEVRELAYDLSEFLINFQTAFGIFSHAIHQLLNILRQRGDDRQPDRRAIIGKNFRKRFAHNRADSVAHNSLRRMFSG